MEKTISDSIIGFINEGLTPPNFEINSKEEFLNIYMNLTENKYKFILSNVNSDDFNEFIYVTPFGYSIKFTLKEEKNEN